MTAGGILSPSVARWMRILALSTTILLCIIALGSLAREVYLKLQDLQKANTDNAQWTFSQIEVDYFRLNFSVQSALKEETPDLGDIRKNFDLFYSRASTLKVSPMYDAVRRETEFQSDLTRISTFLDNNVPLIDGPDQTLINNLPALAREIEQLQRSTRDLSLFGLQLFVGQADDQRQQVANTLTRLGFLSAALFLILSLVAILLLRLYRRSEQAATERKEAAARLSTILSTSLDAVLVVDHEGSIVDYNGAAEHVFGYTAKEAIGGSLADLLIPEKYHKSHNFAMARFIENGKGRIIGRGRVELEARDKFGKIFPVEVSLDAVQHNGKYLFVSFLRDITHEKFAQQELVAARDRALAGEKAKADFLAVMSHEMRTPLNGLLGTLSLLRETDLSASQRKFISNIETSGQLLLGHVNDVLDISKFEAGKTVLYQHPFKLAELMDEVIDSQSVMAAQNGNTLIARIDPNIPETVIGDQGKLRQILLNLVSNATKFTTQGSIKLVATLENKSGNELAIKMKVTDTGVGISPEHIEQIFDDFETLDSTYGRRAEGTGLGLGIARRMTEVMNGKINVESEPGKGSTFHVEMTFTVPTIETVSEQKPEASHSQNITVSPLDILMVEDNAINRFVLRGLLESQGHKVDEAEDGALGVRASEMKAYDLILMDISMPNMDGMQATKHIRAGGGLSSTAPIVAVTAHAMPEEIEAFMSAGMTDNVSKPIDKGQLLSMIARTLPDKCTTTDEMQTMEDEDMTQDVIDIERLEEMKSQMGAEIIQTLVDRFIAEGDEVVSRVTSDAAKSEDVLELVAHMHKVAGSAAALGFSEMRLQLNHMETLGKAQDLETLWSSTVDLENIWHASKAAISEVI